MRTIELAFLINAEGLDASKDHDDVAKALRHAAHRIEHGAWSHSDKPEQDKQTNYSVIVILNYKS